MEIATSSIWQLNLLPRGRPVGRHIGLQKVDRTQRTGRCSPWTLVDEQKVQRSYPMQQDRPVLPWSQSFFLFCGSGVGDSELGDDAAGLPTARAAFTTRITAAWILLGVHIFVVFVQVDRVHGFVLASILRLIAGIWIVRSSPRLLCADFVAVGRVRVWVVVGRRFLCDVGGVSWHR